MALWQAELDVALEAARAAGAEAMRYFTLSPRFTIKSDQSPVSEADHAADRVVIATIRRAFPDDAILTEESGELKGSSGRRWIVDPIDGTRPFLRGLPHWSNLIALEADGDIAVGVLHLPALAELYGAARGLGTWKDGMQLKVRTEAKRPQDAFLTIGGLSHALEGMSVEGFRRVTGAVALARGYGDSWGPALMLSGVLDAWCEHDVELWDIAPFPVLFEEAGATYTDFAGRRTWPMRSGLAAHPELHARLLALIDAGA
jgi:histidinol-phosphatase